MPLIAIGESHEANDKA